MVGGDWAIRAREAPLVAAEAASEVVRGGLYVSQGMVERAVTGQVTAETYAVGPDTLRSFHSSTLQNYLIS